MITRWHNPKVSILKEPGKFRTWLFFQKDLQLPCEFSGRGGFWDVSSSVFLKVIYKFVLHPHCVCRFVCVHFENCCEKTQRTQNQQLAIDGNKFPGKESMVFNDHKETNISWSCYMFIQKLGSFFANAEHSIYVLVFSHEFHYISLIPFGFSLILS